MKLRKITVDDQNYSGGIRRIGPAKLIQEVKTSGWPPASDKKETFFELSEELKLERVGNFLNGE